MPPPPGIKSSLAPSPIRRVERHRIRLEGGERTTVHVLRMSRRSTAVRVVLLPEPQPLLSWCLQEGVGAAMVGGFFIRPEGRVLGELRIDGRPMPTKLFAEPWDGVRACVHTATDGVALVPREELPAAPAGDLLQAGPLLARGARNLIDLSSDPEGFSAGSGDFDSDITEGRYPRAALGLSREEIIAAACEGRDTEEAGLTLSELSGVMIGLGAETAMNLDGGGSTSLVRAGTLLNTPREDHGIPLPGGRPISTALVFE